MYGWRGRDAPRPLDLPPGRVVSVASNARGCALALEDGRVFAWGLTSDAPSEIPEASAACARRLALLDDSTLVLVAAGGACVVLRRSGRRTWGAPEAVNLGGAKAVDASAGGARALVVCGDGAARVVAADGTSLRARVPDRVRFGSAGSRSGVCVCVGGTYEIDLADGSWRLLEFPPALGRIARVACAGDACVALGARGAVACWDRGGSPSEHAGFARNRVVPSDVDVGVAASTAGNAYVWSHAGRDPALVKAFCDAGVCVEAVWALACETGPGYVAVVATADAAAGDGAPAAAAWTAPDDAVAAVPLDFWGAAPPPPELAKAAGRPGSRRRRPAAAAASHLVGALAGGAPLAVGVPHAGVLLAADADGRALCGGGASIVAAMDDGAAVAVEDNGDGTFALTATLRAPGARSLRIALDGESVAGSPFLLDFLDSAAAPAPAPAAPSPKSPPPSPESLPPCARRSSLRAGGADGALYLDAVDTAGEPVAPDAARATYQCAAGVDGGPLARIGAWLADDFSVDAGLPGAYDAAEVSVTLEAPGGARIHVRGSPARLAARRPPPPSPDRTAPAPAPAATAPPPPTPAPEAPASPGVRSPPRPPARAVATTFDDAGSIPAEVVVRLDARGPLGRDELLALRSLLDRHGM